MVVYIKENEIVTEASYTQEVKDELLAYGFQAVTVPNKEIPSDYKYSDFHKVLGQWKLK